jgi:formylmethanofuran dehydrogenase subunit C
MINIRPVREFMFPVAGECICPDSLQGKTLAEIGAMIIWEGNKPRKLGELFRITEVKTETPFGNMIMIQGDVGKVRGIGARITSGEIVIHGNAGGHLGEEMSGGRVTVHGNVGGWAGSAMNGGTIEIYGDAGDYLGAPYRGSTIGMRKGKIAIHGNAGGEAGAHMRGGIIRIDGKAGQFSGFRMRDGTIFVQGDCLRRAGACMTNGKIVVGGILESVLPTFAIDGVRQQVKLEETEIADGPFYVFVGDLVEEGNGKLYVSKARNPQLSHCERLLTGKDC